MSFSALTGCSSVAGSASVSQVRIIDASPDAPGLDVFQGAGVIAYNLGFGTSTSYVPFTPGTYSISGNSSGTKQQLVSSKGTFSAAHQYTVLIGNLAASLAATIIQDQSQAAPTGQIALRFIDQATLVGGVDIYLVPSGSLVTAVSPVLTNVVFGDIRGYFNVPTGTYTLIAMATGVTPTATSTAYYTGSSVAYAGGSATTIVLVDQQIVSTPGLQIITANDYAQAGSK